MSQLLHQLVRAQAGRRGDAVALGHGDEILDYAGLDRRVEAVGAGLQALGLERFERIAVYLPKVTESVVACLAATAAGGVFVPVNPVLKPAQVAHILRDCSARVLVTQRMRYYQLQEVVQHCHDLRYVVLVDDVGDRFAETPILAFTELLETPGGCRPPPTIDADMAAIFYTSGSTGMPKGVVVSHRNLVTGAESVAGYLGNRPEDRLLAVLPFSFDYGFSQLSTAFVAGASCYLMDYLLPRDVLKAVVRHGITGLAAVPPLWNQLAELDWPAAAVRSLRYFTSSGGSMPAATLATLRRKLPETRPYVMYGLTEAFRSTYLPPEEIDRRPGSMGRAIPNAELLVVNDSGRLCQPHEPGELVHRGSLVAMGYWNDPQRTAERFRPPPVAPDGLVGNEWAVWSGDTVKVDEDGYFWFLGRRDAMIKTSGYRVSPEEVEEVIYASGLVAEAVAFGVDDAALGQVIEVVVVASADREANAAAIIDVCRDRLPGYMVPHTVRFVRQLPRNPNGKIDRLQLAREAQHGGHGDSA